MRLVLFLALPLAACSSSASTDSASGDAAAGATIYADNCETCHQADGTGDSANGYPDLTAEKPSVDETIDLVTNGKGDMPAFGADLSEQDILDVAAYVDQTFVNP